LSRRVEILPRALVDAQEARAWYEAQREGLGREFEATLIAAIAAISRFPEIYPQVAGSVRRCMLGRFPFGVFYDLPADDQIVIVAVFHASRDPAGWRERI